MSKRKREHFLAAATELAGQLTALDDELSMSDVELLLRDAGSDPDALWGRFHRALKEVESRVWAKGKTPPRNLRRLVKETSAPATLPADRSAALERVLEWLDRFRAGIVPPVAPAQLEVLRAYRKEGELSSSDVALLDELEEELKRRVSEKDDE